MAKFNTIQTELMCLYCGSYFPIARKSHKQKSENHLKNLWCFKCLKVTKHVEKLRPSSMLRDLFVSANSKPDIEEDDVDWEEVFNIKNQ